MKPPRATWPGIVATVAAGVLVWVFLQVATVAGVTFAVDHPSVLLLVLLLITYYSTK